MGYGSGSVTVRVAPLGPGKSENTDWIMRGTICAREGLRPMLSRTQVLQRSGSFSAIPRVIGPTKRQRLCRIRSFGSHKEQPPLFVLLRYSLG